TGILRIGDVALPPTNRGCVAVFAHPLGLSLAIIRHPAAFHLPLAFALLILCRGRDSQDKHRQEDAQDAYVSHLTDLLCASLSRRRRDPSRRASVHAADFAVNASTGFHRAPAPLRTIARSASTRMAGRIGRRLRLPGATRECPSAWVGVRGA